MPADSEDECRQCFYVFFFYFYFCPFLRRICAIKHVLGLSGVFISTVLVPAMSEVVISSASAGLRAEIDSLANDFFQETFLNIFCIIIHLFSFLKHCWRLALRFVFRLMLFPTEGLISEK